jgi:hypothetical protein
MTNPSPRSAKERAAHREEHSADTYYRRQVLSNDAEEQGRHAKASSVVGASMPYPPAQGINNDAVVSAALNGPEEFGVDLTAAPVVGAKHEVEEAALKRELAQASYEQKMLDPNDPRVGEIQVRIDAAMAELDRRRK